LPSSIPSSLPPSCHRLEPSCTLPKLRKPIVAN
jgi:hypothetical protein